MEKCKSSEKTMEKCKKVIILQICYRLYLLSATNGMFFIFLFSQVRVKIIIMVETV